MDHGQDDEGSRVSHPAHTYGAMNTTVRDQARMRVRRLDVDACEGSVAPILFSFPGAESLSNRLCEGLAADNGVLHWRHFPDGESLVALEGDCRDRDAILVCNLRDSDRLVPALTLAVRTARELGARSVGLVAPYLACIHQDHAGEARSSLFAAFLSRTVDWLVTVDPPLHDHTDLQTLFAIPARCVSAMPSIADWIRSNVIHPVLIDPDGKSARWVRPLAERIRAPLAMLETYRHGDRNVEVSLDGLAIDGHTPVLLVDIISSGHTLAETLDHLRALGSLPPICIAVHGVLADGVAAMLQTKGAARVVTTNTIEGATNAIDVATLLAPVVREQIDARRVRVA
jgi:ribose-phosphate pyrophosphokinase